MSGSHTFSITALVVASAAMAFSIIGMSGNSEDSTSSGEVRQLNEKIDRLEKRLEIAEDREERRLSEAVAAKGREDSASVGEASAGALSSQELASRLEDLGVLEYFEKRREKMQEDYDLVLDSEGEMWTRLKSLSNLQEAGLVNDAVVEAVLPLWAESFEDEGKGGHTRWYLLEGLRGTTNAEFRTQVLDWIGTEESPKMRGQGVQALIPMLPDPNVEEWLRHLAETDPEEGVRNSAAKGLENLP